MKKSLFILPMFVVLAACGSDNSVKPTETVSSLRKVKPGTGGQCVSLDFTHLKCVEGDKALLNDDSVAVVEKAEPLNLKTDSTGRQIYELKYDEPNPVSMKSITKLLMSSKGDVIATTLITYIESKVYSFMVWMSDGGIKADGSVQDYTLDLGFIIDESLPIKYSVDCDGESTTFHLAVGNEGFKTKFKILEDGVYEFENRSISEDGKKVVFEKGYCIPMTIEPVVGEITPAETSPDSSSLSEAPAKDSVEETEEEGGFLNWLFGE